MINIYIYIEREKINNNINNNNNNRNRVNMRISQFELSDLFNINIYIRSLNKSKFCYCLILDSFIIYF
jgi:hypothetical protein